MKKSIIAALILSILVPQFAQASIKVGMTCKKENSKATWHGSNFLCSKAGGKLQWVKLVKKSVLAPVVPTSPTMEEPAAVVPVEVKLSPASPETIDACRAPDMRRTITQAGENLAIAFPITKNSFPYKGSIDVTILGIDFKDVPGEGLPSDIYGEEIKKLDNWLRWYSNNQFKINWHFNDKWHHIQDDSQKYNWVHQGNTGSQAISTKEIVESFIKAGEEEVNFKDSEVALFIFPKAIKNIQDSLGNYIWNINTRTISNGKLLALTTSSWFYNPKNEQVLWAWVMHELIHYMGIAGHSPRNPYQFGLAENQSGISLALNAWDSLILDWLKPSDYYCVSKAKLEKVDISLIPIEREEEGIRSAMVRLSESRVLVIESHRRDKWAHGMNENFKGVMFYEVDTSRDTDRTGEFINGGNGDDGSGKKWQKTAYYLDIPGISHPDYVKQSSATSWGTKFSQNIVLWQGESFIYDGIKITLVKSDSRDTISLEAVR